MTKWIVCVVAVFVCSLPASAGPLQVFADDLLPVKTGALVMVIESDACRVFVDDALLGTTPLLLELASGGHHLEVRSPSRVARLTLDVDASDLSIARLQPALHPPTGTLAVNTDVAGATVLVDGETVGLTPLLLENITAGTYALTIRANDQAEINRIVEVPMDGTCSLKLELEPGYALVLDPAPPDGAELLVYAEGSSTPRSYAFPDIPLLPAGTCRFRVLQNGDEPFEFSADPAMSAQRPVSYTPRPLRGYLRVSGLPKGGVVHLGEAVQESVSGSAELAAPPGLWSVRVEAPGYSTALAIVYIENGSTTDLAMTLSKDLAMVKRAMQPISWTVLASGVVIAGSGFVLNMDTIAMEITSGYAGYSTWKKGTFAAFDIGLALAAVGAYLLFR